MNIFIDSDVIISSFLSSTGAAYILLNSPLNDITTCISNYSVNEISIVLKRLHIENTTLEILVQSRVNVIHIKDTLNSIEKDYAPYVLDTHDAFIVAGSVISQAKFLLTYNIKHYRVELIKRDHNIIGMTPGMFLQYYRSINS